MRNALSLSLLSVACCLLFAQRTKADVTVITQLSYYEPTNSLYASAETFPDYETLSYYAVGHTGYVRNGEDIIAEFNGESYDTEVSWGDFLPYNPDADYEIEVYPGLTAKYNHPIGDTYEDYYNYIEWTSGYEVVFPYYFSFTGPGPNVQISLPSIFLGTIFSVFTQGAISGSPHHLRVIHDEEIIRNDLCGQIQKLIKFQVLDQNNKPAGRIEIDERAVPAPVTDSCSNSTVTLTTCSTSSVSTYGNFTDGIKTGCPHNGSTPCGFDFFDHWRYCRSTPYTPTDYRDLATMYYWATRTEIRIDNETDIEDGTYKYP